ncbi:segregation/condensation protein A [Candidatus Woesearchaeota archaeon]|nr:segregation/condensation protein A [Candidatus Woesearchaeota archaeon]
MEDQIYDMLLRESEITWKDIIYDLIKKEQMDPWDVDLSKLTQRYIETVKNMKEMNYFISGKVLLASALLLKIKSNRLVEEDLSNFDSFLFHQEAEFEELGDFLPRSDIKVDIPTLGIRTPQARKRKVSIADLIGALEKALRVDTRRKLRLQNFLSFTKPVIPERKVDIGMLIDQIHLKLLNMFKVNERVKFSELNTKTKEEVILTLLPLLHLHNHSKVNLEQEKSFEEIHISKFS